MRFFRLIRFLTKIIPYPDMGSSHPFVNWKNRLLFLLLAGLLVLGMVAYIPSIILSIYEKFWAVAIVDTLVYSMVLYIVFSKKLSARSKIKASLITLYVLGIAILVLLGKSGAGYNWLFLFPILSSFFYSYRGLVISTIINTVSLALLTIPVHFKIEILGVISDYSTAGWIVNSINFIVISCIISLTLSFIISNIERALRKERKLIRMLQENKKTLKLEKRRAEEADYLKSAFLANMSHEIRTPMNAILGFSDLITEPDLSGEKIKNYHSFINMAGERLVRLIDDIIDISKIELNQMKISISPMKVLAALDEIVTIQRNKIKSLKKDIVIDTKIPDELKDMMLETDEIRFKQIMDNLLGNAVKYTDKGKITIGYALTKREGKEYAEFYIKDTGRGIPIKEHELIFDRFSQANNVKLKEGTGLGLSIAKGLLTLLGGKVWLSSEVNKGSTFYFTLPYNRNLNEPKLIPNEHNDLQSYDFSEKIIYIAEDDSASFYYLKQILTSCNAEVRLAQNGKELLRMMETKLPDLVLLDIRMPVMSGIEALKEIRKMQPDLPVIAQTACAMAEERQKCIESGCNDYISKPINRKQLLKIIDVYLDYKI